MLIIKGLRNFLVTFATSLASRNFEFDKESQLFFCENHFLHQKGMVLHMFYSITSLDFDGIFPKVSSLSSTP